MRKVAQSLQRVLRIGKDTIVQLDDTAKSTTHNRLSGYGSLLWESGPDHSYGPKVGVVISSAGISSIGMIALGMGGEVGCLSVCVWQGQTHLTLSRLLLLRLLLLLLLFLLLAGDLVLGVVALVVARTALAAEVLQQAGYRLDVLALHMLQVAHLLPASWSRQNRCELELYQSQKDTYPYTTICVSQTHLRLLISFRAMVNWLFRSSSCIFASGGPHLAPNQFTNAAYSAVIDKYLPRICPIGYIQLEMGRLLRTAPRRYRLSIGQILTATS